ncbi:MAG: ATP--guanido phosphotransferase [Clostridia bacterium]|nr:ATP--guanido phosphotransferase [Clostridia bacterium]
MNDEKISDFASSTRIRLARNFDGYAFPSMLDRKMSLEIVRKVLAAIGGLDDMTTYYMSDISKDDAIRLIENHLISPDLVKNRQGGAAIINAEEFISIMINEEDHLREQCIVPGLDLKGALSTMSEIDEYLSKSLKFAYDEKLGYLTACPTNLGTGLRASVMLFLPALSITNRIKAVDSALTQSPMTMRGIYGEGSKAEGYMYQISNEKTLGLSEDEILDMTETTVENLINLEAEARADIKKSLSAVKIKDQCMRSFGVATNCALVSSSEFDDLCTNIKIGAVLGYIDISDISKIDELCVKMKASNINAAAGRQLSEEERDAYRAEQGAKKLLSMIY